MSKPEQIYEYRNAVTFAIRLLKRNDDLDEVTEKQLTSLVDFLKIEERKVILKEIEGDNKND